MSEVMWIVVALSAILIGLIFRGMRRIDEPFMPEDEDEGFEIARQHAARIHEERTDKIERSLKSEDPEEELASDLNSSGGPL
tara:strand:- start:1058 stop:1303 length:246 start_codon:yes stop_codon:yes gene_type:complete